MVVAAAALPAQDPDSGHSVANGAEVDSDHRNEPLRTLDSYFPFHPPENLDAWRERGREIRRRILVSQGLWPMPTRTPLNAVIHGRVERDDYVVDRVYFESLPGHYVTGSLYRPKNRSGPLPAILSPHGHWSNGRFYDAGPDAVRNQIETGAEQFEVGGRYPIQARAVQLARMGCLVFVYDMTGYADSVQLSHRPDRWEHLDRADDWGFMSVQADLRLQNMMGLQTWNSIRAVDFVESLDETDRERIGVTGASGGGTQSMILAAIDERIDAAMPCVMVSTAMQGGCSCENAPLLRIGQGNVDIAAATARRPLGLTAADDWTVELETKGYPELERLYQMLGVPDRLFAVFHTRFPHNYNQVNRLAMYGFFNRHFDLGVNTPIAERDYTPLSREEATVWTEDHPAPRGADVGDSHEVRILQLATKDSRRRMTELTRTAAGSREDLKAFQETVGGGWQTILGRTLGDVAEVTIRETAQSSRSGAMSRSGTLVNVAAEELVRVEIMTGTKAEDTDRSPGVVIWIEDAGIPGLRDKDELDEGPRAVLDQGFTLLAANLFGQADDGVAASDVLAQTEEGRSQRMWYQGNGQAGWQRFSGYTYGYNHALFAQRVHDVLTLIRYAEDSLTTGDEPVHLVGLGRIAGPVAAAARSQAGDAVAETVVDVDGFRFESLRRHDDPMFVPGAVKYLDVPGLLANSAPHRLTLVGDEGTRIVPAIYEAAGADDALRVVSRDDFDPDQLEALLGRGDG